MSYENAPSEEQVVGLRPSVVIFLHGPTPLPRASIFGVITPVSGIVDTAPADPLFSGSLSWLSGPFRWLRRRRPSPLD